MPWFMDIALARRLERAEGSVGASFTAVRQELAPGSGATWREFAGTYAIFDTIDSPLTQTFGLGVFEPATPAVLSEIEAFFAQRDVDTMHEVSSLAGISTTGALADRGYRPIEMSTVLVQDIGDLRDIHDLAQPRSAPGGSELRVRIVEPADHAAWVEASVAGWVEDPAIAPVVRPLAELVCKNDEMVHFLIERGGTLIATASLGVHGGVALLSGAATIPPARGLGAQGLLLAARLAEARRRGCEAAMIVAEPGSTSQRNAERRGFRVAYTRTKWRLARPS